ncbi:MAG: phosphoribosyltransferase [Dehalococcoidia bacterium]|nr:phosphoribosyltransferase [Chloroflexi bacterium CFX7]MCK6565909.1 phosphoribosyltransferase [Dehalococcoidia bacterium]NUQ55974.1 phosphoribosyltransferase [Dehalococcoidia bacterium]
MPRSNKPAGNLWLAEELWKLNGIEVGDFTLGRTAVHSPIYINLRRLISSPKALSRCARIIRDELETLMSMRNPHLSPFTLVAGVPFGGLHVATAFSLACNVPMIYIHPPATDKADVIEGNYVPGQTCLVIDDLITGGGSILQTAATLSGAGLVVRDAVTLIDRQEGGRAALRAAGINLVSILTLEQIANYLMAAGHIQEEWYRKTMEYLSSRNGG